MISKYAVFAVISLLAIMIGFSFVVLPSVMAANTTIKVGNSPDGIAVNTQTGMVYVAITSTTTSR